MYLHMKNYICMLTKFRNVSCLVLLPGKSLIQSVVSSPAHRSVCCLSAQIRHIQGQRQHSQPLWTGPGPSRGQTPTLFSVPPTLLTHTLHRRRPSRRSTRHCALLRRHRLRRRDAAPTRAHSVGPLALWRGTSGPARVRGTGHLHWWGRCPERRLTYLLSYCRSGGIPG